jgi:hypothetical protein
MIARSTHPTVASPVRTAPDRPGRRPLRNVLLRVLADILAGPKGDLGGWEAGARGL